MKMDKCVVQEVAQKRHLRARGAPQREPQFGARRRPFGLEQCGCSRQTGWSFPGIELRERDSLVHQIREGDDKRPRGTSKSSGGRATLGDSPLSSKSLVTFKPSTWNRPTSVVVNRGYARPKTTSAPTCPVEPS